jgi:1A family penicillin-binding protein
VVNLIKDMAQRKLYRKIIQKGQQSLFLLSLKLFALVFLLAGLSFFFVFLYYAKDLPRPERFGEKSFILPTKIYDREGKVLLYEVYGEEKRTIVPLEKVPEHLKEAVISAEDANFFSHFGLDFKGIFRAMVANFRLRKPVQGGSTITQQLVRTSFLSRKKTIERKIKEVILTLELERRYSKEQILEWYLNQIPFGGNAYGVEAASQTYFNKPVQDLSLAESATLASLIQAPSYFSPYGEHKQELLARKDMILERMAAAGYISRKEAEEAKSEELKFSEIIQPIKAPHFVLFVKKYLEEKYGEDFLKEEGLKVYTSLDWELQELAEKAVREGAEANQAFNAYNASLVAINPKNGEILAMVGSKDYFSQPYPDNCIPGKDCLFEPKVNVALFGQGQQPGSAFKPFVYAQAFKKGIIEPKTLLWDVKTEFNPDCSPQATEEKDQYGLDCYHPQNYDQKFRGPISVREALAQSINLPSVKILYLAGIKESIDLAKTMGITTLNQPLSWYGLSLVLGGGEVKLLDLVSAYGVFATEGQRVMPQAILKIEDSKGNIIEENKKTPKRVLDRETTRIINDILSDNQARSPMFGSHSPLFFPGYQVAAKTGTTQDFRDAWTIGYTPSLVVGVWVGNNNNSPMEEKPGVVLAGPIWHNFFEKALLKFPKENFRKPELIDEKKILEEIDWENPHSILYFLNKNSPQFSNWEEGVQNWLKENSFSSPQ